MIEWWWLLVNIFIFFLFVFIGFKVGLYLDRLELVYKNKVNNSPYNKAYDKQKSNSPASPVILNSKKETYGKACYPTPTQIIEAFPRFIAHIIFYLKRIINRHATKCKQNHLKRQLK